MNLQPNMSSETGLPNGQDGFVWDDLSDVEDYEGPLTAERLTNENAEYRMVFATHIPENASRTARLLRGCDTVIIEAPGGTQQEREQQAELYSKFVSTSISLEDRDIWERQMDPSRDFTSALLCELKDTDTQIELMDINDVHRDAQYLKRRELVSQHFDDTLAANAPNEEEMRALDLMLDVKAEVNAIREPEMHDQILEAGNQTPGKPRLIGIVAGPVHTPIFHELLSSGAKVKRRIVTNELNGVSEGEQIRFSYEEQALRQLRLHPESKLSTGLLNRVLLQKVYESYGFYQPERQLGEEGEELAKIQASSDIRVRIIERMSDQQIVSFLDVLDTVKAQARSGAENAHDKVLSLLEENSKTFEAVAYENGRAS